MRITNELKTGKIELILLEAQKEYFPSYKIQIRVQTENFRAIFDKHIWISEGDVHQFLIELEALDRYRTGQAILKTFLPEECRLTFQAIDSLGHLSVILYHRQEDRTNKDYAYELKIEIQIDPTSLPTLRIEMLALIK